MGFLLRGITVHDSIPSVGTTPPVLEIPNYKTCDEMQSAELGDPIASLKKNLCSKTLQLQAQNLVWHHAVLLFLC
jgi:hypothetical protein